MLPTAEIETGWLYVLEIRPLGRVKVGQTRSVADRLATHARTIGAGGRIGAVVSFPVRQPRVVERRLLELVRTLPHAVAVDGPAEVFEGITFFEVLAYARDLCEQYAAVEVRAEVDDVPLTRVQNAVAGIFATLGQPWLPTSVLLDELDKRGHPTTARRLGDELGNSSSKAEWDGRRQVRGYALADVEAAQQAARTRQVVVPIGAAEGRAG